MSFCERCEEHHSANQPCENARTSSMDILAKHWNSEAAELVLRAAADYLYEQIPDGTRMDLDPRARAVDRLDALRADVLGVEIGEVKDIDSKRIF